MKNFPRAILLNCVERAIRKFGEWNVPIYARQQADLSGLGGSGWIVGGHLLRNLIAELPGAEPRGAVGIES